MMYIGKKKYTRNWESYLGSGYNLIKAIKKFGKENFSKKVIAEADSKNELSMLEIKYIKEYGAVGDRNYYNIDRGGESNCWIKSKKFNKLDIKTLEEIRNAYKTGKGSQKVLANEYALPISTIVDIIKFNGIYDE